jgi:hypothetical protein
MIRNQIKKLVRLGAARRAILEECGEGTARPHRSRAYLSFREQLIMWAVHDWGFLKRCWYDTAMKCTAFELPFGVGTSSSSWSQGIAMKKKKKK